MNRDSINLSGSLGFGLGSSNNSAPGPIDFRAATSDQVCTHLPELSAAPSALNVLSLATEDFSSFSAPHPSRPATTWAYGAAASGSLLLAQAVVNSHACIACRWLAGTRCLMQGCCEGPCQMRQGSRLHAAAPGSANVNTKTCCVAHHLKSPRLCTGLA